MPSTAYARTAAVAVAIGVAITLAPHDRTPNSWQVTDLTTQQQAGQGEPAASSRRAVGTRRTGRPAVRTTRRTGERHSFWPHGYCQAIRHSRWPVRTGDTLDLVARCTGADVADLRAANGISGSRLTPGRELVIPH